MLERNAGGERVKTAGYSLPVSLIERVSVNAHAVVKSNSKFVADALDRECTRIEKRLGTDASQKKAIKRRK